MPSTLMPLAALALSGCATLRHPVPQALVDKATVGGMDEIRIIAGETNTELQENLLRSISEESAGMFHVGAGRAYPILAISGGGADGAYSAGFLNGWSKEGSRPVFKIVTGVSTGAIIAPFAFLGSDCDDEMHVDGGTLTQVFTTYHLMEHMDAAVRRAGIDPSTIRSKLYLLRNGYVSPS